MPRRVNSKLTKQDSNDDVDGDENVSGSPRKMRRMANGESDKSKLHDWRL